MRGLLEVYQAAEMELLALLARRVHRGAVADSIDERLVEASRARAGAARVADWLDTEVADGARRSVADASEAGRRTAAAELNQMLGRGHRPGRLDRGPLDRLAGSLASTLGGANGSVVRVVDDAYRRITAQAAAGALSGLTRREAAQSALDRFARAGVRGFVDRRGRAWDLVAYAEMAVRSITARASVDAHLQRLGEAGLDLVVVSNSPQECDQCRRWEGAVLSRSGGGAGSYRLPSRVSGGLVSVDVAGSVDQARSAGLLHPGCTHSLSAFLPGVTGLPRDTANPRGYADRQKLRHLERKVREAKRVEAVAGTPRERRAAAATVRAWQAKIRDHVDATGATRQRHREQITTAR